MLLGHYPFIIRCFAYFPDYQRIMPRAKRKCVTKAKPVYAESNGSGSEEDSDDECVTAPRKHVQKRRSADSGSSLKNAHEETKKSSSFSNFHNNTIPEEDESNRAFNGFGDEIRLSESGSDSEFEEVPEKVMKLNQPKEIEKGSDDAELEAFVEDVEPVARKGRSAQRKSKKPIEEEERADSDEEENCNEKKINKKSSKKKERGEIEKSARRRGARSGSREAENLKDEKKNLSGRRKSRKGKIEAIKEDVEVKEDNEQMEERKEKKQGETEDKQTKAEKKKANRKQERRSRQQEKKSTKTEINENKNKRKSVGNSEASSKKKKRVEASDDDDFEEVPATQSQKTRKSRKKVADAAKTPDGMPELSMEQMAKYENADEKDIKEMLLAFEKGLKKEDESEMAGSDSDWEEVAGVFYGNLSSQV